MKETTNLQARESQYHANAIRELVLELKQDLQWQTSSVQDQDSLPPITSVSDDSNDSSISALQSEVASLRDYIHNMHGSYTMPMQPTPPPYNPQQAPWIHPFAGMQAPPYQAYCQQVSPYQMTQNTQDGANPP